MPPWLYFARPHNQAFHNLCKDSYKLNTSLKTLLGLGLNFIPRPQITSSKDNIDTNRFIRNAYTKFYFAGSPDRHVPTLFVRSKWTPDSETITSEFRSRVSFFLDNTTNLFKKERCCSNLLPLQKQQLFNLKNNEKLKIVKADKNLGPVVMEHETYVLRALQDHLNDKTLYRQLDEHTSNSRILSIKFILNNFIKKYFKDKTNADRIYLERMLSNVTDPYSYFYLLAKVHKTPWTTRPIVSVSGSILYGLGKWVDSQLKIICKKLPYIINSSYELCTTLRKLKIDKKCLFFSMDAVSMYTNIDTTHALTVISEFLKKQNYLDINTDAVIQGLTIIMRHNLFKFGDTFWIQLSGTAMGTPPAPSYATLYYAIHEMSYVPRYPNLQYYGRYIDDVIGIWLPDNEKTTDDINWNKFQKNTPFGVLQWEFTSRTTSLNFLDVQFTIILNTIETSLYEKELNLYLYLPPHSSHSPGMIKGLISGMILRIQRLTSNQNKILPTIKDFYFRLLARGYSKDILKPIFIKYYIKQQQKIETNNDKSLTSNTLFLHLLYHPKDPSSQQIQEMYRHHLAQPKNETPSESLCNQRGCKFNTKRLIIAYHRHPNLGNLLSPRKLNLKSEQVSTYLL